MDDNVDAAATDADFSRQPTLGDAVRFQELLDEDLTGRNGAKVLRFGSARRAMHAIAALIRGPIKIRASFVEALFDFLKCALAHGV